MKQGRGERGAAVGESEGEGRRGEERGKGEAERGLRKRGNQRKRGKTKNKKPQKPKEKEKLKKRGSGRVRRVRGCGREGGVCVGVREETAEGARKGEERKRKRKIRKKRKRGKSLISFPPTRAHPPPTRPLHPLPPPHAPLHAPRSRPSSNYALPNNLPIKHNLPSTLTHLQHSLSPLTPSRLSLKRQHYQLVCQPEVGG